MSPSKSKTKSEINKACIIMGVYVTRQLIWRQTESSVLQNTEIKI